MGCPTELCDLAVLSARIGRNPLLTQASSGNTSMKIGGTLWIKASGKWLASALEDEATFVAVPLDSAFDRIAGSSVETATHAVLPQKVVIHVHSVNAISWAVRSDGYERLVERLAGIAWQWIPYVASGMPLARYVEGAVAARPELRVFVLANHGLFVSGDDCADAEARLEEVERRLAAAARVCGRCDDPVSRRILEGGILYPCQAMFLGAGTAPFSDPGLTVAQRAVLEGLAEVVRRIDEFAPLRYLSGEEVDALVGEDIHRYLSRTESNARCTVNQPA